MNIVKENREIIKNIFLMIFEKKYHQTSSTSVHQELNITKEQINLVNEIMYDMSIDDIEYVYSQLNKLEVVELTDDVLYFKNGINGRKMGRIVDKIKSKIFQPKNQQRSTPFQHNHIQRIKFLVKENNKLIKNIIKFLYLKITQHQGIL